MLKSLLFVFFGIFGLLVLSACLPVEGWVADPTRAAPTITRVIINPPVVDEVADLTPAPQDPKPEMQDPTPVITDAIQDDEADWVCQEAFCALPWPGWLRRPIGEGLTRTIDRSYPYGSTAEGKYDLHHGVEFQNRFGTPVLATQDGEVIFAGMDNINGFGPFGGFYGQVIVLYHPGLLDDGNDVYTLYAHLSEIRVEVGNLVRAGEEIGKVGATGAANGPHLHFETRVDANDYAHTVNPILWFPPLDDADHPKTAALAGVVLDRGGNPVPKLPLTLEKLTTAGEVEAYFYPATYYPVGINPHPLLDENFAVPDIPAGNYRLTLISGRLYEFFFTLEPGSLGFLKVQLD